ncbi:MAG TPA: type III-B CRISPR module-associated Cmr3 family protein [Thermoanaerobaculaceae bacterium]|nr:type III-B CRISPR module-associated Cmr3 family protein [Thermoanaerobaculaceae bacterium]HRS15464.1 type III-B CRISPR module-associated Cmr3 family protein [Thermoanaerobaculaceae bacterium]
MSTWLYLEPLDVLYLRGNRDFGGPGDHAEALMPPWPSVFSGALRSALLARSGVELGRFTDEGAEHCDPVLAKVLGTPWEPGSFRLACATLARSMGDGVELLFPFPADLVVSAKTPPAHRPCKKDALKPVAERAWRLRPVPLAASVHGGPTAAVPVLAAPRLAKPGSDWWLRAAGMSAYLEGKTPEPEQLVHRRDLWDDDFRLGIGRNRDSYTTEAGHLYTTQAAAPCRGVGFAVEIEGCPAVLLEPVKLVRLGGDGRGASVSCLPATPWKPPKVESRRLALVLLTPGILPQGWLLPGTRRDDDGTYRIECDGFSARLACAAVPRAQVVSGWDLPAHKPKPAQRAVPAGSVYYLEDVDGDVHRYLDNLWDLICDELTQRSGSDRYDAVWKQRKAEGFNNILVGRWPHETAEKEG